MTYCMNYSMTYFCSIARDIVMTETEFNHIAETIFRSIETQIESFANSADIDIETMPNGNVLEIIMPTREKIILNTQRPLQEIWAACALGASHFSLQNGMWWSARDQIELSKILSVWLTHFSGIACSLKPFSVDK